MPDIVKDGFVSREDRFNTELRANVRPEGWTNPEPAGRYNLVVIGAGTAGLVTAAGAAGLGAKVALVERHALGGDCLNYGCVPSKGVIRAARVAYDASRADEFGVRTGGVTVDFAAVMERMRRLRAGIAHHDSSERFRDLGVDVYLGEARFMGPDTVQVGETTLRFSRAVIATGARAVVLPIPGLKEASPLTNESVFDLVKLPRRLLVIGAGPIGCELAQSFRRLGSEVVLLNDVDHILPREDRDAADILQEQFEREGIRLVMNAALKRVEVRGDEKIIHYEQDGQAKEVAGETILLGVGRAPNVEGLGLEAAGVAFDRTGVKVDDHLRTSNRRIFAAGDICSPYKFTHAADAMARIVIQNALFFGRKKASALKIPWCTYTDPEIAHVGLYEGEAQKAGIPVTTLTLPLSDVDRAILDGQTQGFARVHLKKGTDEILGATVVSGHAGDLLAELTLAMTAGLGLSAIAGSIHPYPTQGEVVKRLGDAYNRTRLTPRVKYFFEKLLAARR
jgi:pyruvate/2-oxoglutarate dehydrogenase complex dihydrolipoamide dehydrogenase (E3) component